MHSSIISADMGLSELPQPVAGSVRGRRQHTLRSWSHLRETQLNGDRFKGPQRSEEEDGASGVGLPPVHGVDAVKEWEINVMKIEDE